MINLQKLTKIRQKSFEQETVINFNELEDEANYVTASHKEWTKMDNLGIKPFRQSGNTRWYKIPKAWIKIRPPKPKTQSQLNTLVKARQAKKSIVVTEVLPKGIQRPQQNNRSL